MGMGKNIIFLNGDGEEYYSENLDGEEYQDLKDEMGKYIKI